MRSSIKFCKLRSDLFCCVGTTLQLFSDLKLNWLSEMENTGVSCDVTHVTWCDIGDIGVIWVIPRCA